MSLARFVRLRASFLARDSIILTSQLLFRSSAKILRKDFVNSTNGRWKNRWSLYLRNVVWTSMSRLIQYFAFFLHEPRGRVFAYLLDT